MKKKILILLIGLINWSVLAEDVLDTDHAAVSNSLHWLHLLDTGFFEAAYEQTSPVFWKENSFQDLKESFSVRQKVLESSGERQLNEIASGEIHESLFGDSGEHFFLLSFQTSISNQIPFKDTVEVGFIKGAWYISPISMGPLGECNSQQKESSVLEKGPKKP